MEVCALVGACLTRSATGESCVVFVSVGPTLDDIKANADGCCFRISILFQILGP